MAECLLLSGDPRDDTIQWQTMPSIQARSLGAFQRRSRCRSGCAASDLP